MSQPTPVDRAAGRAPPAWKARCSASQLEARAEKPPMMNGSVRAALPAPPARRTRVPLAYGAPLSQAAERGTPARARGT